MTPTDNKLSAAILFADLVDSTGLYESVGDNKAHKLMAHYVHNVTQFCQDHSGIFVKSLGDGILAYFKDTDNAIQSAIDIQQSNISLDGHRLLSHIGIHYGDFILGTNDIFGDAVNLASRLSDIARAEQTIVSEQIIDKASNKFKNQCRYFDTTIIKGKKDPINIYELTRQNDDQTVVYSNDEITSVITDVKITIKFKDQQFILNEFNSSITIGRDSNCDITIDSSLVSRNHAKIYFHKDKFFYIDQSTNGSYIQDDNQHEIFLRREQTVLSKEGVISAGLKVRKNKPDDLIYFSC